MFHRFIFIFLFLSGCGTSQYGTGASSLSCIPNPYSFHRELNNWQDWERRNYYVSCARLESELQERNAQFYYLSRR